MKGNHYRAIFISDVHLGTSACQAHYLKDFLIQNTCDTLYLVGDISSAQAFIHQFERIASRQAQEKEYDGYICGHIHHWQMQYYNQALYVNDGDWVEHCTALVETLQGELQLLHWADHKSVLVRQSELEKPLTDSETQPGKNWGSLQGA